MKRIVSCLLAVVLVFTPCLHIRATESGENAVGNDVLSNGQEESRAGSETSGMAQVKPAETDGMAGETNEVTDVVPGDGLAEPAG